MSSTCKFEFDQDKSVFHSGDFIKGRILLTTTSDIECNGVYIEFLGRAKVEWSSATRENTFQDEVIHAHSRTEAFPQGKLPEAVHAFDFQVQIPNEAPSSCIGAYGEISYVISLVISRPRCSDNKYHHKLTVLKPFDLNSSPKHRIPMEDEDIKNICCWPCSSGPIISKLELPFSGYVPGQTIKYKLSFDNQSTGYDLYNLRLKLDQLMFFNTLKPHKAAQIDVTTIAQTALFGTVLRLTKRVVKGELLIPAVPPTLVQGVEGLINIMYILRVDIKTNSWQKDSRLILPVTIGTVPLKESESNLQTAVEKYQALRLLKTFLVHELVEQVAETVSLLQE